MKKIVLIAIFILLLTGCDSFTSSAGTIDQLTPYVTHTAIDSEEKPTPTLAPIEITPEPTSTPRIHIVALNDTISSIALQYGVTIDAILKVNPDIEPTTMIVGDEVVIPGNSDSYIVQPDTSLLEKLQFGEENCVFSGGGLWCGVLVRNGSGIDLELPVVKFTFEDQNGDQIKTINVPAILRNLPAGEAAPVVAFLEDAPSGYSSLQLELFSVVEPSTDGVIKDAIVEESFITLDQLSGTVTGSVRVESSENITQSDLTLVAVAVDADGRLIGVRRLDSNAPVNESIPFDITVYSTGDVIADIIIFIEAY